VTVRNQLKVLNKVISFQGKIVESQVSLIKVIKKINKYLKKRLNKNKKWIIKLIRNYINICQHKILELIKVFLFIMIIKIIK
jgi:hypothetical protein